MISYQRYIDFSVNYISKQVKMNNLIKNIHDSEHFSI